MAKTLYSTPAKAGVQYRAGRNWTPAFAGVVRVLSGGARG